MGQRSSPVVIDVVRTWMRCSFRLKLGEGTGWLVISFTAVLVAEGWRIARWVVGRAAIVEVAVVLVFIVCFGGD